MKRLFCLVLFAVFGVTAQAQYSTTVYTDTTLAGQITEAQSAAALLRGFTGYTVLRSDANDFINRYVQFRFRGKTSATLAAATSFTTDSVKVQGLLVKKTASNVMDTVWRDIELTYTLPTAINTGAGSAVGRDTSCVWIAAGQTGVGNAKGYITPQFKLPAIYDSYRVVNGTKDSGRVVIKEIWERIP